MGSTNHGNQTVTYSYFESATSQNFNKRHVNIQPRGIYKGGYLTKVSNTEVTLSPFTLEIGDSDIQIGSKSSVDATLNSTTLDSGSISPSTPYLVFRWAYTASQSNYVEIHAIASVSAAQSNDIIIGKCVFTGATLTGFSYTDRTFLSVQDLFLKVVPNEAGEMYVWVRAGKVQTSSQYVFVPEQRVGLFTVPSSPNSRIDLVYVDTDGSIKIQQGTSAVSPSVPDYGGKLVLAQIRLVNGDSSISASRITDVRSFIAKTGSGFQVRSGNTADFSKGVNWNLVENTWTDLDLSSIIPVGAKAVSLRTLCVGSMYAWCRFRSKSEIYSGWSIESCLVNWFSDNITGTHADMIVGCDSNRKIQYFIPSGHASRFSYLAFRVSGIFF